MTKPNSITPVYVEAAENVEVDVNWLYCLIPAQYAYVYHKLLLAMADLGIDMLQDCKASCRILIRDLLIVLLCLIVQLLVISLVERRKQSY